MTDPLPAESLILIETRRTILRRSLDALGGPARQSALVLLEGCSRDEIFALIAEDWPMEAAKLRRRHRIQSSLALISAALYLLIFYEIRKTGGHWYSVYIVFVMVIIWAIVHMRSGSYRTGTTKSERRQLGFTHWLTIHARIEDAPLLVDAFKIADKDGLRPAVKQRLAELLPLLHTADVIPLDDTRQGTLLRELQSGLAQRPSKAFTEADAAFLAAVLMYFEHAATSGQPVPQAVLPLLTRFATLPIPEADACNRNHWRTIHTAAGDCLDRLQIRGR